MLRDNLHAETRIVTHGFIIAIQAEEGTDKDLISTHLADACRWVEGVGESEVTYMGQFEEVPAEV